MNEILKQRLVGALILIALGVVFWPIIFVEPGDSASREERRIPARPGVNTEPIAAPQKDKLRQAPQLESRREQERQELERASTPDPIAVAVVEDKEVVAAEPVKPAPVQTTKDTAKTRTKAPVKPTLDSEGVPIAWILQVASVSKPEKADELRRQLLELGHKAYVKKIHRSGNVLLRVYIGPKFERAQLDKIKPAIDTQFGVQSMVVRYLP